MKIRLICVGKLENASLRHLAEDYAGRLKRFCELEICEVKDARDNEVVMKLRKEAEKIEAKLQDGGEKILLDEKGESMDSQELSRFLERKQMESTRRLCFIIGSSHGLAPELKASIPKKIQISRFTLTHEMARVLWLEQIYRGYCILHKIPYHH